MSKTALASQNYELIKGHILDPDNSPLPEHLQEQFTRITSVARVLDKNPTMKHAVAIHRSKYPHIIDLMVYIVVVRESMYFFHWYTSCFSGPEMPIRQYCCTG